MTTDTGRIVGEKVLIDTGSVKTFFQNRAIKYSPENPVVSMLYQDKNPELAKQRDEYEKNLILPLLDLRSEDKILDIGCGIGRWAETLAPLVSWYHGTDAFESLLRIAEERTRQYGNLSFQQILAQEISPRALSHDGPFPVILIAGVLHYINDDDCERILQAAAECSAKRARIFIRGPIALNDRLTLNKIWSEELGHEYSAIYRTREEFEGLFKRHLLPAGFTLIENRPMYPAELNNRKETQQHIFLLSRDL